VPATLVAATSSRLPGERLAAAVVLSILMALVSLVLLVACTNVTGVLIARADARRHEMAVRLSIGAGRARLVRQLLVETLLLFGIGALAGIATARGMMRGLVAALPALPVPLSIDVPLDLRVFAFTIGLAAMAAIASGLVPALRASRAHPASALKAESGGTSSRWRLRSAFVVGQASISVALVFTAVVFTRALVFAVSTDPGYDSRDVEIVTIDLSARGETPEASLPFWRSLIERVRQLPGLESASLARALPGGFETMGIAVAPPDRAASQEPGSFEPDGNIVAPGYFKTMGIPLIAGRDFTSADVAGAAPVTIVGEAAARHYWPGRTAVGQYLEETTPQGRRLRLVVGVVRDVRSSTLIDGVAQSVVYLPLEQERSGLISTMTVVARASGTRPVAADVRAAVASLKSEPADRHDRHTARFDRARADSAAGRRAGDREPRPRERDPRGHRHLRRVLVCREPPHPRVRNPDGARCEPQVDPQNGARAGRAAGTRRNGHRHWTRRRRRQSADELSVRHSGARSGRRRRDDRRLHRRRRRRLLRSGPAGDQCRPARGPAA
jgi:putative ABC transport system permease protein